MHTILVWNFFFFDPLLVWNLLLEFWRKKKKTLWLEMSGNLVFIWDSLHAKLWPEMLAFYFAYRFGFLASLILSTTGRGFSFSHSYINWFDSDTLVSNPFMPSWFSWSKTLPLSDEIYDQPQLLALVALVGYREAVSFLQAGLFIVLSLCLFRFRELVHNAKLI